MRKIRVNSQREFGFQVKDRVQVKGTSDRGTIKKVEGIFIHVDWDPHVNRTEIYLSNQLMLS